MLGQHFTVRTDHHNLRHLWQQKITTPMHERWRIKLMAFDFSINYKKGKENVVADSLSRQFETSEGHSYAATDSFPSLNCISMVIPNWIEVVKEELQQNLEMKE